MITLLYLSAKYRLSSYWRLHYSIGCLLIPPPEFPWYCVSKVVITNPGPKDDGDEHVVSRLLPIAPCGTLLGPAEGFYI